MTWMFWMNYDRLKKKQKTELVVKLIAIIVLFKKLKKHTLHQQQINFRCQPAVLVSRAALAR